MIDANDACSSTNKLSGGPSPDVDGAASPSREQPDSALTFTVSSPPVHELSRTRSFSWGFLNEAEELTFSMTLSASDGNLAGRGLAAMLPVIDEKEEPAPGAAVRRVLTMRLDKRALRRRATPGRRCAFTMVLFWRILPVVGAVVLAAGFASPLFLRPALGGQRRGSPVPLQASAWSLGQELEYARAAALRRVAPSARIARLEELTRYERVHLKRCTQAMAEELHHSAARELTKLTLQLSPLRPPRPCAAPASSFPHIAVAAMGFTSAAIEALAPSRAPLDSPRACDHAVTSGSAWVARGVPGGFDGELALRCAELSSMTYHSTDCAPSEAASRLRRDLRGAGLQLVAELCNPASEVYALVARNASAVFVAFRGSATVKNVMSDLDYANNEKASREYRTLCGGGSSNLPWQLHGGFAKAYLSIRQELVKTVAPLAHLDLVVTGHSMGGALAVLASLDLKSQQSKSTAPDSTIANPTRVQRTYTFAAPRVGDTRFALTFERVFSAPEEHWALQAPSDAVPHLPFAAWGFQHPRGVFKLAEWRADAATDRGDCIEYLRPREGRPLNWATCHDISAYSAHLRHLLTTEDSASVVELNGERTPLSECVDQLFADTPIATSFAI